MNTGEMRDTAAAETTEATRSSVTNTSREADHKFRLLATMVQGTAATLPEAWQSYAEIEEARSGAREMLRNHRVLRVALVENRIPMQFVEWIGR